VKQRFLQLEPRQQLWTAGTLALVVVLLAAAVLLQLHKAQLQAQQQLQFSASELAEVQTLAERFAALHTGDQTATGEAVDMTAVVSRSLQAFGLQPSRIQQGTVDELQLRLDGVQYTDVIAWLAALEQSGTVVLLRATFSGAQSGSTNLTVSLKKRS
jgi:type II secretory pathway component PulM